MCADPGALSEEEDPILAEEEFEAPAGTPPPAGSTPPLLRPGIVHRLDMGTTGDPHLGDHSCC